MKISIRPLLVAGGFALALLPATYAGAQSTAKDQQARLEQSARNVNTELGGKTGDARRSQLLRQQREIDEAMRKLKAGQKVSTEEIDRILGEVSFERAR
jgi:hypothetical protein